MSARPISAAFTVDTTAVALVGTENRGWVLHNNSANTIYLGGSDVTTSTGLPVAAGAYFSPPASFMAQFQGRARDQQLYAIAGASSDVRLLAVSL